MYQTMQTNVLAGFDSLIEQYYQPLFHFAVRLSGTPEAALDLTQQTFYLAIRKCQQLREPRKFKSWIFTILHREFLQRRRHETKFRHHPLEECHGELPRVDAGNAASLDVATMKKALEALDENHKVALTLYYIEELSQKEIAGRLGIPVGTVMSRISRGKRMMRRKLERNPR